MVLYNKQALADFDRLFDALLHWEKIELNRDFTIDYVNKLKKQCESISKTSYHFPAVYKTHKRHGNYVHRYRCNHNTTWYIIYNIDLQGHILINRILSNHVTQ